MFRPIAHYQSCQCGTSGVYATQWLLNSTIIYTVIGPALCPLAVRVKGAVQSSITSTIGSARRDPAEQGDRAPRWR
jgi:hypothetical protein